MDQSGVGADTRLDRQAFRIGGGTTDQMPLHLRPRPYVKMVCSENMVVTKKQPTTQQQTHT
jgi:hypothetical protein